MIIFKLHIDYDNNNDFKKLSTEAQNISESLKRS